MAKIYSSVMELIGGTPLMKLNNYMSAEGLEANLLGKLEFFNPAGSVKDRVAKKMIEDFGLDIKIEDRNKYKRTHQSRNTLISKKPKVVMIREKLEQWLKHATDVLIRYLKWIQFWKEIYKPEPDEEWHELFTEALANERKINDYLDVLMFGTGEEIVEFFKMKRREVEKIEERINEYQREVLDGIRRCCERGNAYNRRCQ